MSESIKVTDDGLMRLLAERNPAALEFLYDRHSRAIYSLALQIMGDPLEAELVLQDTFFQLWQKSPQFDSGPGPLLAWLLTITRQRAIGRLRRRNGHVCLKREIDEPALLPQDVGPSFLDNRIAGELVRAAFAKLPEPERQAIQLAYFGGFTCAEIANRTKTQLGMVKTCLRSALKSVKRNLLHPPASQSLDRPQIAPSLENVLITEQLGSRACRPRDSHQETKALDTLAEVLSARPHQLIDAFLRMPLDLCRAGTGGLSLLETDAHGGQVFRWTNLSGTLAKYVGGTTPRNFSPCGVTLDRNAPQLFEYPARHFDYFNSVDVPIVEGLVIPFHVGDKTEGTVWIVSHDESLRFDSEDARIMTTIAEFAGCAFHLNRMLASNGM